MAWLFSYGPVGTEKLGETIGRDVMGLAAYLPGYEIAFRGEGSHGSATLERADSDVFGYIEELGDDELAAVEQLLGNEFAAVPLTVYDLDEQPVNAVAFVSTVSEGAPPSRAQLEQIAAAIRPFWRNEDGDLLTWRDFDPSRQNPKRGRRRARQPCEKCGAETYLDAYVRDDKLLCEKCATDWDARWEPDKFRERWVDKD